MRLIYLSSAFYARYDTCPEILKKPTRPYACLSVQIDGKTFAIPFRHHIAHKYAFFTYGDCGLDYTKSVLILHESDIDERRPQIEQKEFDALKGKEARIIREFTKYVKLYCKAAQNRENPYYKNIVRYSALQYFEEQLL